MLGAHKPLHLRQAEERRQKLLPDLVSEQTVAVLREGRGVEHPVVDLKPDEPAKQHVELQPFDQLPLRAERIEKLAEAAPAGWTDARSPGKAPKTSRRAQPKPRSSAAASPAADAAPGSAPRPRRKRTRPRSSDPRPASTPRIDPPESPRRRHRITPKTKIPEPFRATSSEAC